MSTEPATAKGMIAHSDLLWDEIGQCSLRDNLADCFASLEAGFLELATDNGCKVVYPGSLLSAEILGKLDYLHSFPQHATFPCCLEQSQTNLDAFCQQPAITGNTINLTQTEPVAALLLPAACYSVYPTLQSQSADAAPQMITLQARCFRRETHYQPLERQWNFSMRELVCAGSEEQVQAFLEKLQQQVNDICSALALPVEFATATDPFFNPEKNPQYIMQRISPSKTEVVYGGSLAIASLNFHRQYFGEAFDLHHGDEHCHTACVAFGLERWLAALLREHGDDVRNWPALAAAFAGRGR